LFCVLSLTRRLRVLRLGRTVLVHGQQEYRQALTDVPLDRVAPLTTGGAARALHKGGVLFDQAGTAHRQARRTLAADLGTAAVDELRPLWQQEMSLQLQPLRQGGRLDVVSLARAVSGATAAALLELDASPLVLADAARQVAAATVGSHLPAPVTARVRAARDERARRAVRALTALCGDGPGRDLMIAIAAVSTSVAAFPRAVAWTADAALWTAAADPDLLPVLVGELLRVTAPSPVLPRAAAADARLGGVLIRRGDRLVLVARSAAGAARHDPDVQAPRPAQQAQLVFGAGQHACPGAGLARAQLHDLLAALAPFAPEVVLARADRHAALPSWARLEIRATR
jgi:cytochrome P450